MAAVLFLIYIPYEELSVKSDQDSNDNDAQDIPIVEECSQNQDVPVEENAGTIMDDGKEVAPGEGATDGEVGATRSDSVVGKRNVHKVEQPETQAISTGDGPEGGQCSDEQKGDLQGISYESEQPKGEQSEPDNAGQDPEGGDIKQTTNEGEDAGEDSVSEAGSEYLVSSQSLPEAVREVLNGLGVRSDVWTPTQDQSFFQIKFVIDTSFCDQTLYKLTELGIGYLPGTSVSLLPTTIHYQEDPSMASDEESGLELHRKKSLAQDDYKSEFKKSIKSRLIVAQVVEGVEKGAKLTFDFTMFIILASMIACLGLAENSSVILVASMLVSPLMGPILSFVFGLIIQKRDLVMLGLKTELIGLSLCLVSGFFIGLIMAAINIPGAFWGSTDSWPTMEMKSRGLARSLGVGILIALPSGAGVALSVLGGNAGSLVGVAISASLLPPAVNAGMLWAYGLVAAVTHPPRKLPVRPYVVNNGHNVTDTPSFSVPPSPAWEPPHCPPLRDNSYQFAYSCHMSREAFMLGLVSLALTILNILCIILVGYLILKLKEVVPHTAGSNAAEAFWKRDIKIARESYKTAKGKDSQDLAKMAREIVAGLKDMEEAADEVTHHSIVGERARKVANSFTNMIQEIENDNTYNEIVQKTPMPKSGMLRQISCDAQDIIAGDVPEDQQVYLTVTNPALFTNRPKHGHVYFKRDGQNMLPGRGHLRQRHPSSPEAEPLLSPSGTKGNKHRHHLQLHIPGRKVHWNPKSPPPTMPTPAVKLVKKPRFIVEPVEKGQTGENGSDKKGIQGQGDNPDVLISMPDKQEDAKLDTSFESNV